MHARHEVASLTGERTEQRDTEHAAGLPGCIEHAGGDARTGPLDAAEQRRGQRRHQKRKPAADDRQLHADFAVEGAGLDADQGKASDRRQTRAGRDRRGRADALGHARGERRKERRVKREVRKSGKTEISP